MQYKCQIGRLFNSSIDRRQRGRRTIRVPPDALLDLTDAEDANRQYQLQPPPCVPLEVIVISDDESPSGYCTPAIAIFPV